jgi:molecular chaperone HscC
VYALTTIGIDLGTTNSLVAYWTDNGPKIIPNVLKQNLTPSVVSVDENGEIYVGQIAKERMITHPHLTASTFKRYMGTEKTYELGQHKFTPEELSSFVIRSLKSDAETYFNCEITEAVISVPAYFNDFQRKATKLAAELAGLKVERLISEPTAASISYGLHNKASETKFLVFDLGGGTFDVSILEFFEGIMDVKSIAGDVFLGGEDFTDALVEFFIEQNKIDKNELDYKTQALIKKQAEMCKLSLSQGNKSEIAITIGEKGYTSAIDRAIFEKLVSPLLIRLRQPIDRALRDAELSPKDLDAVILIGGATRMPVIKSVIAKMFNLLPYSNINPDEAVALGAAIQVALKERNAALEEVILTDVCPYSLGVDVAKTIGNSNYESGYFLPIIERNSPIPISRVERLVTLRNNQREIQLGIYQGESRRVENNIKLGELNVKVPPAPAGKQAVDVRYTYDINGILEVEVTIVETGVKKSIIIEKSPGSMTKFEIDARLSFLREIKIHPREKTENKLLLARGERIFEESLGEAREVISFAMDGFEAALATQDIRKIKKAADEFTKVIDEFERRYEF